MRNKCIQLFLLPSAGRSAASLKRLAHLLEGDFDYHEMGKNHFFINRHYWEMTDVINARLGGYLKRWSI